MFLLIKVEDFYGYMWNYYQIKEITIVKARKKASIGTQPTHHLNTCPTIPLLG